jgi:hypothetical protein
MATYEDFLKTVTPTILSQTSSSTNYERTQYWRRREGATSRHVSARYELTDVHPDYFDAKVSYEFLVRTTPSKEVSDKSLVLLTIACTFEGHFHAAPTVDREHAEQFVQKDSWLVFWPYFRQFVSDVTARMSIRPELLPLGLGPGTFSATSNGRDEPTKLIPGVKRKVTARRKTRGH